MTRRGMAGLGVAWLGRAGLARRGEAWPGVAWRGWARRGRAGTARHGSAGRGWARQAGLGWAWLGGARRGGARRGVARRGGTFVARLAQLPPATGVTPQDDLVFGYRRLLACRDMLGWAEIDTRVVNVTSIAAGEYAENEMRKNFTVSERVAILETIKLRHRGQPKKYSEPAPNSFKTREDAARLAGLGNTTTAREATVIVNHGIPELREAVDRSEIGIEPASLIAQQTQEQQAALLKMPKQERNAVLRQFRPASKHNSRKAQQAQPAVPPPRPSRFGGPRPAIHHLSPEQRGMPSAEEMNDQALGQPQGVTKAILHQRKYGHVQLWEPAEAALIELDGGRGSSAFQSINLPSRMLLSRPKSPD